MNNKLVSIGWLDDNWGNWEYLPAISSLIALSNWLYVKLLYFDKAAMKAYDIAPVAAPASYASAEVWESLQPDHIITSAALVFVSSVNCCAFLPLIADFPNPYNPIWLVMFKIVIYYTWFYYLPFIALILSPRT